MLLRLCRGVYHDACATCSSRAPCCTFIVDPCRSRAAPQGIRRLFETTNPTWSMSGSQMDPLQWCDIGLITPGHTCGACAIVVLVSVHRSLVCREVVGSRAVVRRKMRCGSDQKGSMCTVSRESVPRWSLRIQPTRSSDAFRRESELQCTELCTVVCSS